MVVYVFCHNASIRFNGGMQVLFRIAEAIRGLGHNTKVLIPGADLYPGENPHGWKPTWFESDIEVVDDVKQVRSRDIVLIHEEATWAFDAIMTGSPRYAMINQGAAFSFCSTSIGKTKEIYRESEGVMTVSKYISKFVNEIIGIDKDKIHNIGNVIDSRFKPAEKANKILVVNKTDNVANKLVIDFLANELAGRWVVNVVNKYPVEVLAQEMATSKMMLFFPNSSGEGLGLPPIEAAVSGCKVIGYHGQGGKVVFEHDPLLTHIEHNDITSFIHTAKTWADILEHTDIVQHKPEVQECMLTLANYYSKDNFTRRVQESFNKIFK